MLKYLKLRIFGIKQEPKNSFLITKGVYSTCIPSTFIDGNKNPVWDNNHKLLKNSKKTTFQIW